MTPHEIQRARAAWLAERKRGLGATDVASICGVGFLTPQEVYAEKVAEEVIDREPTPVMRMGQITEPHNAELYADRTGRPLSAPGLLWSQSHPWAFATYDRIATERTGGSPYFTPDEPLRPVELKYAALLDPDEWGPDGTDETPEGYLVQTNWQCSILLSRGHTVTAADVSTLSGFGDHRVYTIPFNADLAALLLAIAARFWCHVVERRPPAEDWRTAEHDQLREKLAQIRPDTSTDLGPEGIALVEEIDRLSGVKDAGEEAEKRIREKKVALREILGTFETGNLPDGRRVKLYPYPAAVITPKPYERKARIDVRILAAKKEKKARE